MHTATVAGKHDGVFECAYCGLKKGARARALGTGTGQNPYLLNERGARERATSNALDDATSSAEERLLIVPCPSCGKRNEAAARAFVRSTVNRCALIACGGIALSIFFGALGLGLVSIVAGVFALLGPLPHAIVQRSTWRRAAQSVEFFDGEAPDRPVSSKPCAVCGEKLVTEREGLRCRLCGVALHRKKCRKRHAHDAHAGETGT